MKTITVDDRLALVIGMYLMYLLYEKGMAASGDLFVGHIPGFHHPVLLAGDQLDQTRDNMRAVIEQIFEE